VVWPESATPCYLRHKFVYLNWIKYLSDSLMIPILTGSPDYEWTDSEKAKTTMRHSSSVRDRGRLTLIINEACPVFGEGSVLRRIPFSGKVGDEGHPELGDYSPGDSSVCSISRRPPRAGAMHLRL